MSDLTDYRYKIKLPEVIMELETSHEELNARHKKLIEAGRMDKKLASRRFKARKAAIGRLQWLLKVNETINPGGEP